MYHLMFNCRERATWVCCNTHDAEVWHAAVCPSLRTACMCGGCRRTSHSSRMCAVASEAPPTPCGAAILLVCLQGSSHARLSAR